MSNSKTTNCPANFYHSNSKQHNPLSNLEENFEVKHTKKLTKKNPSDDDPVIVV